jgi:ABC-2 type transport system ATP-binding protein
VSQTATPAQAAPSGAPAPAPVPPASGHDGFPLVLRGVSKRWHKSSTLVLDGVDLELDIGSRTWVGGRNGAGKTTLLRIAAGLIDPDRGRATVWGFGPHERRSRYHQLVAFLPAGDRGLYARLTVRRQLAFWAAIAKLDREVAARRVEAALDDFDLRGLADHRVDRMSMGQRQRLRIALAFLPEPETVLLDEPLTSLDAEGAELLGAALDRLTDRGGALLWASPSGDHPDLSFDHDWFLEDGGLTRV